MLINTLLNPLGLICEGISSSELLKLESNYNHIGLLVCNRNNFKQYKFLKISDRLTSHRFLLTCELGALLLQLASWTSWTWDDFWPPQFACCNVRAKDLPLEPAELLFGGFLESLHKLAIIRMQAYLVIVGVLEHV